MWFNFTVRNVRSEQVMSRVDYDIILLEAYLYMCVQELRDIKRCFNLIMDANALLTHTHTL